LAVGIWVGFGGGGNAHGAGFGGGMPMGGFSSPGIRSFGGPSMGGIRAPSSLGGMRVGPSMGGPGSFQSRRHENLARRWRGPVAQHESRFVARLVPAAAAPYRGPPSATYGRTSARSERILVPSQTRTRRWANRTSLGGCWADRIAAESRRPEHKPSSVNIRQRPDEPQRRDGRIGASARRGPAFTPQHVNSFLSMPGHNNVGGLGANSRTNFTNLGGRTTNINNINSFNRINNTQVTRINNNLNNGFRNNFNRFGFRSGFWLLRLSILWLRLRQVRSLTTGLMVFADSGIRMATMVSSGRDFGPRITFTTHTIGRITTALAIRIRTGGARRAGVV